MPHIVSIACTPPDLERRPTDHYARMALQQATLVAGRGIAGDVKSRGGLRQLNVMRAETVAELLRDGLHTAPGELGEQLVIGGLEPAALAVGVCLQLGAAVVIEITSQREPCNRFATIQGCAVEFATGRIGAMARVIFGGAIAVGDAVQVLQPQAESA